MSDALTITEPQPRSITALTAFRDHPAFLAALQAECGLPPPTTPGFIRAENLTLSCLAPGRYLATAECHANLPLRFAALSALAAITDQSDQWHTLILTGPVDALARLVPINLAPASFPIGGLALTRAGHLNIRLWHVAEATYEIATSRSYAADLSHALQALS